jgi:hypothetical protein
LASHLYNGHFEGRTPIAPTEQVTSFPRTYLRVGNHIVEKLSIEFRVLDAVLGEERHQLKLPEMNFNHFVISYLMRLAEFTEVVPFGEVGLRILSWSNFKRNLRKASPFEAAAANWRDVKAFVVVA